MSVCFNRSVGLLVFYTAARWYQKHENKLPEENQELSNRPKIVEINHLFNCNKELYRFTF